MKPQQIEAEQLVERYIRGALSGAEAEEFEQRLLWDTELQQQLELTTKLRDGLRAVVAAQPAAAPRPRRSFFASPLYAAAATVLLGITTFGWLFTATQPPGGDTQVASARVYSLDAVRSAGAGLPVVTPGTDGDWLTLLVYPDLAGSTRFRAELARMSSPPDAGDAPAWQSVWTATPTATGNGDTVAVTLRGDLLTPGRHRLQIVSADADRPGAVLGEVQFRVPGD